MYSIIRKIFYEDYKLCTLFFKRIQLTEGLYGQKFPRKRFLIIDFRIVKDVGICVEFSFSDTTHIENLNGMEEIGLPRENLNIIGI